METPTSIVSFVSIAFEAVGVAVIIGGFFYALWTAYRAASRGDSAYEAMRATFGRGVLLGLEILVAADIIRTVTVELTIASLTSLAILVAVRTFLSWSLEVEIEGRWPWQRGNAPSGRAVPSGRDADPSARPT